MTKNNVLTIGAYERDNFGDILFYYIAKKSLRETAITPGSIVSGGAIFGDEIVNYDKALKEKAWSTVWIVGGEVGGATVDKAKLMLPTEADRVSILQDRLAYIPDSADYENLTETKMIANSVGALSERATAVIQGYDNPFISVRDKSSFTALIESGIDTVLVPDVVHALPFFYKIEKDQDDPYILFQVSKDILQSNREENISKIADQLVRLSQEFSSKVCLLPAGIAPGHDSMGDYDDIKNTIEDRGFKEVFIHTDRDPLAIVAKIANAKLWVGSSLHGRIISIAYGVPRVSFAKTKLDRYSQTWDSEMPYGVSVKDFADASRRAVNIPKEYVRYTQKLTSNLAFDNLRRIVECIEKGEDA
ncbi:MAG: polysaccharide pyruvyl transferase family protein [Candidatus Saccharimonadales bacterium]